ncbi:hypothetical protein K490DRAFT_63048 [Saccharata proteae CBS 121410]|uniref:RRM domain-containing protein n=1 Tax=Saccharata proteae CBS 121410 TaxID=1314787 RepID=A0A9P4M0H5_9PEZI|nr:hypothetical protein K490DRAFT_63048 [Saccharata proteae CBS 121410]
MGPTQHTTAKPATTPLQSSPASTSSPTILSTSPHLNGTHDLSPSPTRLLLIRPFTPNTTPAILTTFLAFITPPNSLLRIYTIHARPTDAPRGYAFLLFSRLAAATAVIEAFTYHDAHSRAGLRIDDQRIWMGYAQEAVFQVANIAAETKGTFVDRVETGARMRYWREESSVKEHVVNELEDAEKPWEARRAFPGGVVDMGRWREGRDVERARRAGEEGDRKAREERNRMAREERNKKAKEERNNKTRKRKAEQSEQH